MNRVECMKQERVWRTGPVADSAKEPMHTDSFVVVGVASRGEPIRLDPDGRPRKGALPRPG